MSENKKKREKFEFFVLFSSNLAFHSFSFISDQLTSSIGTEAIFTLALLQNPQRLEQTNVVRDGFLFFRIIRRDFIGYGGVGHGNVTFYNRFYVPPVTWLALKSEMKRNCFRYSSDVRLVVVNSRSILTFQVIK